MDKGLKQELIKSILEYYYQGYSSTEMLDLIRDKHEDEEMLFNLIKTTITKARKVLTEEQKSAIEHNRKLHKEAAKDARENERKDLAALVKNRAENDVLYTQTSVKLQQAIKSIAKLKGFSEDSIREYVKRFYPEFYEEYMTNANLDEEYYLRLANKIVDKGICKSDAQKMIGFSRMMKCLEENHPLLLERVNNTFAYQSANGARSFEFASINKINFNNVNMLVDIILEFRMPLEVMCDFISKNNDIFLHDSTIVFPEDLDKFLRSTYISNSLEWYLAEMNLDTTLNIPAEFIERKKARFDDFCATFQFLKHNFYNLEKYVYKQTAVPMESVMAKVNAHSRGYSYDFTNDDIRSLIKNIYKYGLTELDINHYFGIPRISNLAMLEKFELQDIDDHILYIGYRKLTDFNRDIFYSKLQGRA